MSSEDLVLYQAVGPVATITLNRPKAVNAINGAMRPLITAAIQRAEADDAVRVIVLRGAGKGFCAGADIAESMLKSARVVLEDEFRPMLLSIHEGKKLSIAQVHGPAAGIGAALAMACDFMVMAEDATIYMAFAAIALIPDGGATQQLIQAMGYRKALEAIVEGQHSSSAECLRHGIANKVVPVDRLEETVRDWAARLSEGAPLAQAAAKRVLRQVHGLSYEQAILLEAREQEVLTQTADCREAVMAFFEKRKPVFKGR